MSREPCVAIGDRVPQPPTTVATPRHEAYQDKSRVKTFTAQDTPPSPVSSGQPAEQRRLLGCLCVCPYLCATDGSNLVVFLVLGFPAPLGLPSRQVVPSTAQRWASWASKSSPRNPNCLGCSSFSCPLNQALPAARPESRDRRAAVERRTCAKGIRNSVPER